MTLYTIGTEKRTPVDVAIALLNAGVTRLVDVRSSPNGHYDPCRRDELQPVLEEVGIMYTPEPSLGVPAMVRRKASAQVREEGLSTIFAWYRGNLPRVGPVVDELRGLMAGGETLCLLCYERDPLTCHRSVLADCMAPGLDGETVVHL